MGSTTKALKISFNQLFNYVCINKMKIFLEQVRRGRWNKTFPGI